jgi:hypothetical protein
MSDSVAMPSMRTNRSAWNGRSSSITAADKRTGTPTTDTTDSAAPPSPSILSDNPGDAHLRLNSPAL